MCDLELFIISRRGAREYVSFVHVCMYVAIPSCNCILEQTEICAVYNTTWVISDS